ncbi:Os06g0207866 [Oryza sativa Japonica Group]|uniref:Os06g0207866 protein n=1 Tax=Oryza sativa subsp. japonica TaxID=39947 RepID=A0A0P0WUE1_ORYSJ|nr:Os06g0207866 [Oryza sativa Japonica Group]
MRALQQELPPPPRHGNPLSQLSWCYPPCSCPSPPPPRSTRLCCHRQIPPPPSLFECRGDLFVFDCMPASPAPCPSSLTSTVPLSSRESSSPLPCTIQDILVPVGV